MKLTTRFIDAAKPDSTKDTYLRDGNGLELRILRKTGKKVWQLRYTFEGKRRVIGLGDYSTCSLKDARLKAMDARKLLSTGMDPAALSKTPDSAPKTAAHMEGLQPSKPSITAVQMNESQSSHRLIDLVFAYVRMKRKNGQSKYANDVERSARLYLLENAPEIANKPANQCTPEDIASVIRPIHARGKIRSADKLRSFLSAAFKAAMQAPYHPGLPEDLLGFSVTSNPVLALPSVPVNTRDRFLTQNELGQYGATVLSNSGITYGCLALALLAGGQRPLQVSRITDTDYDAKEGILLLRDPKGKRHAARSHYLPVGPVARAFIEKLQELDSPIKHPIWFSQDGYQLMSATTLSHQCTRIQKHLKMEPFQLRDIRRTVETEMARIGISKDLRAHLLSHGLSGIQDRHYDRYDRINEKRAALESWEKHLMLLINGYIPGKNADNAEF
ncbi:phage-related integrase [Acidithiobacillus caldus SM-1]|uniref:Phage-related integrase n=1 Tax=Acidithiobacillus caldus (strain SM-1) TaxID=990288 RepID=F9ZQP5_ACICS|nr:integrase family protein [Acidithiobacillus caldus]AEK58645.1 phage-related integrase [Acidithiobacillus caldus SM-1]